ncbi:hypothetical protein LAZ67_17000309 [Cordylochernes scorpioides]|uniref:Integrase catalytic domain-containing protein n=1 Tax=Cordylochernes scorpioides TaxID=51811 RepID=A0ABY6LDZ9_9ARAC|nr:hypothetical protein LAZ67_17000309 [Cordylochernes scorpioides]
MNGIRHTKTSPYNPSTNGLAERYVREFKNLLRKNNGKDDLETNLQSFLFAHRAFPQTVIKEFPGGTANEEKFKIKILEFNTKMGNPRELFHEAVRRTISLPNAAPNIMAEFIEKNDSSSDRIDLGYYKSNSGSDHERTLGPQEAFCIWVPKLLTPDQKTVRRKLSSDNLALFEANPEEFVNRFVTMDETWTHHFTPYSKQQYMQWRHSGSPSPQESQVSSFSREVYGVCLLGSRGCTTSSLSE